MNPVYFVIIALAAAFLIALIAGRIRFFSSILACVSALTLAGLSLYALKLVNLHKVLLYSPAQGLGRLGICLVVDGLSGFMLVIVNLVAVFVLVYSFRYMRQYTDRWKFYSLYMFMLAGMNGVLISGDLFSLYLFLELAALAGYSLVAFGTQPEDLEAAFRYVIIGTLASVFILLGIALLYSYTSTLNLADIAEVLSLKPRGILLWFVTVLFLSGFSVKAALVPFHSWLADAHSTAPAPVSATLSGVFIKTLGVYALGRIFFNVLGVDPKLLYVLMVLGLLSMVVGAFLAIAQDDIKRMFAYSSISQIGYIVFAFGIGTPLALLGGLFHLFNHACFKSLLFLNAGSIESATATRSLRSLGGLQSKLPVTGFAGFLGAMSISGVPPFGGFWSKLIIILAALQAGYVWPGFIAVLVSIITLGYYLKFHGFTFLGKLNQALAGTKEVAFTMKAAMLALAFICVFSGILLLPPMNLFLNQAVDVLVSGTQYKALILGE